MGLQPRAVGHLDSKAELTGKADKQTYKQNDRQTVAKEVKSHFPWTRPSKYGGCVA